VAYLAFNALGSGSLRDAQAREAIAHAINRPALMQILLSGYALPVTQFLTAKHVGYDPKISGYDYSVAKSRQLLSAAGHPTGLTLTFTTSPTYDQRIVQAIQGQLQQAGITVRLQSYDFGTYLQKIQSPQHDWGDLRFGQWSCACLDADGVIYPLFRTGSIWSSFSDPAFDAAVDAARSTIDARTRTAEYTTALQVLQKDVAGVPLWQVVALYGAGRTLRWHPTVDEQLFVADMMFNH
jgi:peptide/nickel transport system substrate-binding protein